jgi:ATP-binding cassette, subfamily F, member 3
MRLLPLAWRLRRRKTVPAVAGPELASRAVPDFHISSLMVTIRKVSKSFAGQLLFADASLQINAGDRVALVGQNGSGKSTIFNMILRREEPDSGEIIRDEWSVTGYLPQQCEPAGDESVLEVATGRAGEIDALSRRLRELEESGAYHEPEYFEVQTRFDALQDPAFEARVKQMLRGLGFTGRDFFRPVREMSGGWMMRAHLARLLATQPDLLMLDEPTNHLDLQSLLWLQEYLKSCQGSILLISHDREFMDAIVGKVYNISDQRVAGYTGNYSRFLVQQEQNFKRQSAAWKNQQKEIRALEEFAARFLSVASKAAQAQSKLKQLERIERIEKPILPKKPFRIQIPQPERSGQRVISLEGVRMAYGDNVVYDNLDLSIERGERTVLVGPNGAGKSTLLKMLAGVLEFQGGVRNPGHNLKIGYFSQHRSDTLDPDKTVLEEVLAASPTITEDDARGILGSFLFKKENVFKNTTVLSGGEKSRLNLVKFLVDPPNLLLMDEPTTHLDILTVESLILALSHYEGTLVFISHDVHFIRKLAKRVLHVVDGGVNSYPGGYDYFLEKTGGLLTEREALVA